MGKQQQWNYSVVKANNHHWVIVYHHAVEDISILVSSNGYSIQMNLVNSTDTELDIKEILKDLLQQLINSNFIQNFHKLQVHFEHSITPLFSS